jgi:hypothetical protein
MGLKITRLTAPAPNPKITVNARLFRTADNKRLVGEGHPDGAFLFCTPDDEVDAAEFESFELDEGTVVEEKAEPQPEDKAVKVFEDKGGVFPSETPRQERQARRKRR